MPLINNPRYPHNGKVDQATGSDSDFVIGSRLAQQLRETDAVSNVLTFAEPITAIEIYHEAAGWQTFTVNGLTLTVPPGGYRTLLGGTPGTTVGIPAAVACIVGRLE
jgi:hypothetical protein